MRWILKKIIYILSILFFVIVYTSNIGKAIEISYDFPDESTVDIFETKNNVTTIQQDFTIDKDMKLYAVSVKVGTYAKKNTGDIVVSLKNENGKILTKNIVSKSALIDNDFNQINFFPIKLRKNTKYNLCFEITKNYEGNRVTFYKNAKVYNKKIKVDDKILNSELKYKLFFLKNVLTL